MLSPSAELTMSSKVPQDVVDVVIDHLHADMKTLKTCSLVCNGWVPSSSWHLFSTFSWPPCTSRFGSLATCPKTPTGELPESCPQATAFALIFADCAWELTSVVIRRLAPAGLFQHKISSRRWICYFQRGSIPTASPFSSTLSLRAVQIRLRAPEMQLDVLAKLGHLHSLDVLCWKTLHLPSPDAPIRRPEELLKIKQLCRTVVFPLFYLFLHNSNVPSTSRLSRPLAFTGRLSCVIWCPSSYECLD